MSKILNKDFDLFAINKGYITLTKDGKTEKFNIGRLRSKPLKKVLSKMKFSLSEFEEEKLVELIQYLEHDEEKDIFDYKIIYRTKDNMFYNVIMMRDENYEFQDMQRYYDPDEYKGEIVEPNPSYSLTVYKKFSKEGIFGNLPHVKKDELISAVREHHNFTEEEIEYLIDIQVEDYRIIIPENKE